MGQYTEVLNQIRYEISPEDDNYTEQLICVMKSFHTFGEALTTFICENGFEGDCSNVDEKVKFIKTKFQQAGIYSFPRNLKKCFTEQKRIAKRKIIFQFCFAFQLSLEECEEFFRKVCLQRGFDCHYIEEAIYYYAISNHLTYAEVQELLEQAPDDKKGKIDWSGEVLFTESIIQEINRFKSKEQLIQFFNDNLEQFGYNNATAYKYIKEVWRRIEMPRGLAEREKQRILEEKKLFFSKEYKTSFEKMESKKLSTWDIYLQMLGLYEFDYDFSPLFVINTDRTLKPILENNDLLHSLAEDSFPDRQGIEGILRGEHKSDELVRKMIILLVFYKFWITLILKKENFESNVQYMERCHAEINRYLVDSGYPTLYAGNPYDWIFMFASQDKYPLDTFRYFMRELYINKAENQEERIGLQSENHKSNNFV